MSKFEFVKMSRKVGENIIKEYAEAQEKSLEFNREWKEHERAKENHRSIKLEDYDESSHVAAQALELKEIGLLRREIAIRKNIHDLHGYYMNKKDYMKKVIQSEVEKVRDEISRKVSEAMKTLGFLDDYGKVDFEKHPAVSSALGELALISGRTLVETVNANSKELEACQQRLEGIRKKGTERLF